MTIHATKTGDNQEPECINIIRCELAVMTTLTTGKQPEASAGNSGTNAEVDGVEAKMVGTKLGDAKTDC